MTENAGGSSVENAGGSSVTTRTPLPPLITNAVLRESLQIGAATGGAGFALGTVAGILRSTSPFLFGIVSGAQCFGLGTTFWGSRSAILSAWHADRHAASGRDRVYASSLAGGFTGVAIGLITRGRSNAVPGGIMFSLFGCAGQGIYNALDSRQLAIAEAPPVPKQTMMEWLAKQKWSPFSILTDEQYIGLLNEQVLKFDVEIALVDDHINDLKKQQAAQAADKS